MEFNRRKALAISTMGVATAALPAHGAVSAEEVAAVPAGLVTETLLLTGADADHTVDWDFQVTAGRRAGEQATIPTPSNWECHGFGSYHYGGDLVPAEKGNYRHSFTPPASWAGRRIFLVFEAAMTDADVRVDGVSAGPVHQGGFYRFRYDVTALLRLGEANLLEVTVSKESADNSVNDAERRGDFWNFGGLFRPVSLEAYPAARIDRVAIDARADGTFTAQVTLAGVSAAGRVSAQLRRLDGTAVGGAFSVAVASGATGATLTTTAAQPPLWTAETPNLHQVELTLASTTGTPLHSTVERFGFRTIEVRTGDGVYVNGKRIVLKGANRHTFWPTLTGFSHFRDGTGRVVQCDYSGDLTSVRWRLDANGRLRLEYRYHATGDHDHLGVNFDYPEANVRGMTVLGDGPYRVYTYRLRGVAPDVWSKPCDNTATGASGFAYPEFKGYHARTCWAVLDTTEGAVGGRRRGRPVPAVVHPGGGARPAERGGHPTRAAPFRCSTESHRLGTSSTEWRRWARRAARTRGSVTTTAWCTSASTRE